MSRRLLLLPLAVLLIGCVATLPACKKKTTDTGGGGEPGPGPGPDAPGSVSSDYVVFAHLRAKDIRDSALFKEVKEAFAKAGGTAEWDKIEGEAGKDIGITPTDIDAVTVCVTEAPPKDRPKYIVILTANKPVNKGRAFGFQLPPNPDSRGLYPARQWRGIAPPGTK